MRETVVEMSTCRVVHGRGSRVTLEVHRASGELVGLDFGRVKREKATMASERERVHNEILTAMTELTQHITYVQGRLNEGVQVLADKKASLLGLSAL